MSQYEISGTVHMIGETKSFASGFTKREFVVETDDEKYPQMIKLEAVKQGCDQLDAYKPGDPITVGFNIRGNEHNGKYYVSLSAWKFDRSERRSGQNGASPPKGRPANRVSQGQQGVESSDDSVDDDIPF